MADQVEKGLQKAGISVSRPVLAVICILFGILLLIFPELVGIIIGIFLLVQGILLLIDYYDSGRRRQRTYTPTPPPQPAPPPPESETPPSYPSTET